MTTPSDPHPQDRPAHDPDATPPTAAQPTTGHDQPAAHDQPAGYGQPAPAQPTGYGQPAAPGYQDPAAAGGNGAPLAQPKNGLGTTALVLGIVGLLLAFIPVIGILGALLGIVGVIVGFIGRGRVKRGEATNGGVALTGIILSFLAILITIAYAVLFGAIFNQVEDCLDPSLTPEEAQACVEEQVPS